MKTETIIIQHKAFFDYCLLNKLLIEFSLFVKENNIGNYFYKKIQIVMIEMLENNYQYIQSIREKYELDHIIPEFKILKLESGFKICASNPVLIEDTENIKSKIDKINNLSLDQLKELYKEVLKEEMFSEKNTSGTGLIRIAKVAKNKIRYSFQKIDNKLLYYTLEIMVNPK
ncbi:MAG TPA: hypothetical protein DCG75_09880 [Bacteroidales bacterium]|nr:hypothetical protein [Bacteroidales bacterium]